MTVNCLKCGSPEVILTAKIDVDFKFGEDGKIILVTDVSDEIYWSVEYEKATAICECKSCGNLFSYDDWKNFLNEGGKHCE